MRFLLVDASHLAYRCRYAEVGKLSTSGGRPSGVVYGFIRGLGYALKETGCEARNTIVVWDGGRAAKRMELCPEYKESRRKKLETPEEAAFRRDFYSQMDSLGIGLPLLGVRSLKVAGAEADDLIALLSAACDLRGDESVVFTGDKDMQQLIARGITVFHPQHGRIDENKFREIWGIDNPLDIVKVLAITGDKSDDIAGVVRVGEKRAALVLPFWDKIWDDSEKAAWVADSTWKWVVKCRENRELIKRNMRMITLPKTWEESFYPLSAAIDIASQLETRPQRDVAGFLGWLGEWEISDANILSTW